MRACLLTTLSLILLRVVIGMHFFLEGSSHLRDPGWSSAAFRRAAVGPLGELYRGSLPETGDFSGTIGRLDDRSTAEVVEAWSQSVVRQWKRRLDERVAAAGVAAARPAAEKAVETIERSWQDYLDAIGPDLANYRGELARLAALERSAEAGSVPYVQERVAAKRRELAGVASGWNNDAAGLEARLVAAFADALPDDAAARALAVVDRTSLWKADRFVSWSLVTIGAGLVLGLLTRFHAIGGACFLASVVASQPFWVPGAQATYDQWVELAALLVIATLPAGGWLGLDYFLTPLYRRCGIGSNGGEPAAA